MRSALTLLLVSSSALACSATGAPSNVTLAAVAPAEKPAVGRDGQSDFAFFVGTWKLHNRRLTAAGRCHHLVRVRLHPVARHIWNGAPAWMT
jgi:hypothetical protein